MSLNTTQIIHIVAEVAILMSMTVYFMHENKKLVSRLETLSKKVESQEEKVTKHDGVILEILKHLDKSMSKVVMEPSSASPLPPGCCFISSTGNQVCTPIDEEEDEEEEEQEADEKEVEEEDTKKEETPLFSPPPPSFIILAPPSDENLEVSTSKVEEVVEEDETPSKVIDEEEEIVPNINTINNKKKRKRKKSKSNASSSSQNDIDKELESELNELLQEEQGL